jgi:dienelactone hydrolase
MTPLEVGLILSAAVLCGSVWAPPRFRSVTAGVSAVAVAALGLLAVLLDGPRWEWLLLGVAAAGAAVLLIARRGAAPQRGRASRIVRRTGAVVVTVGCLGLVLAAGAAAWALPRPHFATPAGPYQVGTTTAQWTDPARPEPATVDPDDRRAVVAQAWYPAAISGGRGRAWYLGRTAAEATAVTDGLADTFGVPRFLLNEVGGARGTATVDAPVADGSARYPVVLFSPGLTGVRTQNTVWATELASRGYVVVALDHPYDSAAVVLDGGQVVTTKATASGNDAEDNRRADGWTSIRAADLRFALDELNRSRVPGMPALDGHLDSQRVAVAGHSLGGAAALQAAAQDRRFRAVLDLDGLPRNLGATAVSRPLLALVSGQSSGSQANDAKYATQLGRALQLSGPGSYRITVPGAGHLTFTDAPFFLPPLPSLIGSLGRTRGAEITAGASEAFLDATLNNQGTDQLAETLGQYGTVSSR